METEAQGRRNQITMKINAWLAIKDVLDYRQDEVWMRFRSRQGQELSEAAVHEMAKALESLTSGGL